MQSASCASRSDEWRRCALLLLLVACDEGKPTMTNRGNGHPFFTLQPPVHSTTNPSPSAKQTPLMTRGDTQFGQSLQLSLTGADQATAAKDLVRWKGDNEQDVQALRIYLGAWNPQPGLTGVKPVGPYYGTPTPWNPQPYNLDQFNTTPLYARVTFGSGGVRHVAFLDWNSRGSLFQLSASYVQVDAIGTLATSSGLDLPLIHASIGPEPGGGDSAQPATFTYPYQTGGAGTNYFQVPPFARAFQFVFDRSYQLGGGGSTTVTISQVAMNYTPQANYVFPLTLANDSPDTKVLPVLGQTAVIAVQLNGGGDDTFRGALIFHLDL